MFWVIEGQGGIFGQVSGIGNGSGSDEYQQSLIGEEEHLIFLFEQRIGIHRSFYLLRVRFLLDLLLKLQTNHLIPLAVFFLHHNKTIKKQLLNPHHSYITPMPIQLKYVLATIVITYLGYMFWKPLRHISYTATQHIMNQNQLTVCYVTASSKEEAQKIATALVERKLAACCNLVEGVSSVYTWQNKTNIDAETLMIIKSRTSLLPKIEAAVKELHSYKVPEVIAMPIIGGSQQYLKWVLESTLEE